MNANPRSPGREAPESTESLVESNDFDPILPDQAKWTVRFSLPLLSNEYEAVAVPDPVASV